jgi:hypothetical protein
MYLPITEWPDQNPILFPCRHNRRSNHVTLPSLPPQTLKLYLHLLLTTLFLLTTMILLIMPLLLTTLLLLTMLLLLLTTPLLLTTRTP